MLPGVRQSVILRVGVAAGRTHANAGASAAVMAVFVAKEQNPRRDNP